MPDSVCADALGGSLALKLLAGLVSLPLLFFVWVLLRFGGSRWLGAFFGLAVDVGDTPLTLNALLADGGNRIIIRFDDGDTAG